MTLTESKAQKAPTKPKKYQLPDSDGLFLLIDPSGRKSWRYRYADPSGKRPSITLGSFPELTVKQARIKRDQFKIELADIELKDSFFKFSDIAAEWIDFKIKNSLGDMPRCGVLELAKKCLDNDLLPILGNMPFNEIKRIDLVNVVRKIESRGVKEPVKKACSYLNQIYDYAVAIGRSDFNIATNLNKVLIKTKIKINYPHLKGDDIHLFVRKIAGFKADPIVKKALWLKLYTGVRGAEIIQAKATDFDLENKVWRIPAVQVKQLRRKALMGFDVPDYIVPLSDQAIDVVKSAVEWSHGEKYIFSSPRKVGQHIHFNSINAMIRRMEYSKDELSSHGLRSTMSTVLNDSGLFKSEWIEAQLSHSDKNQTRGSYNHADYIDHRLKMINWWADYLNKPLSQNKIN